MVRIKERSNVFDYGAMRQRVRWPGWQRLATPSIVVTASLMTKNILRLGSNLILTRLLFPEAFALIGVVTMVMVVLELTSDMGTMAFMVRHENSEARRYQDGIWTIMLIRSLLLAGLMVLSAPAVGTWLEIPEIIPALQLMSLHFVFKGFSSLQPIMAVRSGNEGKNAVITLGVQVIIIATTLLFAWWLRSFWALVIGMTVGEFIRMITTYVFYKHKWSKFYWNKELFFELFAFSKFVIISSMMALVLGQFDRVYVLQNLDLKTVGLYFLAANFALPAVDIVTQYYWKIFYPFFMKATRQSASAAAASYYQIQYKMRLLFHVGAGFGITAGSLLIAILLPESYHGAGLFFSILIIKALFLSMAMPLEAYIVAQGQIKMTLYGNILRLIWLLGIAAVALYLDNVFILIFAAASTDLLPLFLFGWIVRKRGVLNLKYEAGFLLASGLAALMGWLLTSYGMKFVL